MKIKRILSLLFAAVICLSLAACGNTGTVSDTNTSGEETVITLTENWGFSSGYPVIPASDISNYGIIYWARNFYNTLVCYNENGEIQGELADDWTISDDGLTYTFTLRDGVKFSDGTKLTADAVKTSFEAAIYNLGQYNGSYGKLTSIIATMEAIDEMTFVMTLSQPYYATLNDLTMSNPLSIVNPAGLNEDMTPKDDFATQTMGTGPYMYTGDTDGTTYSFIRNPYYWGETPEVDNFKIKVIEDNDAKVLALRSGEIDVIIGSSRLSYDAYIELSGDSNFGTGINDTGTLTRYVGMNLAKEPFDDINVRRAVAYALDRETLCSSVFQGIELPAETLFETSRPYCDVEQTTYTFDLEKANALMEEAGWIDSDGDGVREKNGQKLELTTPYSQSSGSLDDAALAIASQLEMIGFEITPSGSDLNTWYSVILSGDYEISMYATYGGAYDPATFITNMNPDIGADPLAQQVGSVLEGGNSLLLELDSTSDLNRVQAIYTEVLSTNADQSVMIPISYSREFAAWNSNIIMGYDFHTDSQYVYVAGIHLK